MTSHTTVAQPNMNSFTADTVVVHPTPIWKVTRGCVHKQLQQLVSVVVWCKVCDSLASKRTEEQEKLAMQYFNASFQEGKDTVLSFASFQEGKDTVLSVAEQLARGLNAFKGAFSSTVPSVHENSTPVLQLEDSLTLDHEPKTYCCLQCPFSHISNLITRCILS